MTRLLTVLIILALITACSPSTDTALESEEATQPEAAMQSAPAPEEETLADINEVFETYFAEAMELNPVQGTFIGQREFNHRWENGQLESYRDRTRELNERWLDKLSAYSRENLSPDEQVSLDILSYQLKQSLEGNQFPTYLIPINQFVSLPSFAVSLGSGNSAQPFQTYEDYHNWLHRSEGIVESLHSTVDNLKEGVEQGVVNPRVVMQKVLPQISSVMTENAEDSLFWQPISNMPDSIPADQRESLTAAYESHIEGELMPALKQLHDYISNDYMPHAREEVGMWALPGGEDWYNFRIKTQTTTDLTAEEIHEFGLSEVARIRGEMIKVARQVGFEGTLAEFFEWLYEQDELYFKTEEEAISGYMGLQDTINAQLPRLFDVMPKTDYEVRPVEAFRAESAAGASYQRGAPDGSRPGIFYLNTFNLRAQPKYGMETLSLHEASPGHHFQITIQQEIENMPMFRRFGGFTAFAEGWALYAESLGHELGLFTDPYQYYGRLSDEMLRAMRLVVDTGMHAKQWTREQAIDYMRENSSLAETDVVAEVERYIAIPGQALAYKVGQRIISGLRAEAEEKLGDQFDIRAFHRVVLTGGSMPMDVLQRRVRDWIDSQG